MLWIMDSPCGPFEIFRLKLTWREQCNIKEVFHVEDDRRDQRENKKR